MAGPNRQISMSIIADTRRYQQELAKIPGMSDKAAAKAAQQMVRQEQKRIKEEERLRKKAAKDQEKLAKETAVSLAATMRSTAGAIAAGFGAAAVAGKAIIAIGQDIADTRNELSDLSVETGISAETLAALRFGANAAGKDLSNLNGALKGFSTRLVDASKNGGDLANVFEGLGVDIRDSVTGELRNADDVFRDTTRALASVEDAQIRTAAAVKLFSESGGELVNVTQVLGGDFDLFAGAVERVGVGMEGGAENAAGFQRAMAVLDQVLDGIKAPAGEVALVFAQGLAGGIELAKITAMTAVGGFRVFASSFELIRSSLADGTIPAVEDFSRVIGEEGAQIRAELLAEVDAFRALIGSIETAGGEVGDLSGLMGALTTTKGNNTRATKEATDAEKTAAKVSEELAKAKLAQLDPAERLNEEHTREIRALQETIAKGADAAEVAELQALKFAELQKAIQKINDETAQADFERALIQPLAELEALGPQIQAAFDQLQREMEETKEKNKQTAESFADLTVAGLGVAAGFAELTLDKFIGRAERAKKKTENLRTEIEELKDSLVDASEEEREQIKQTINDKEKELEIAEKRRKRTNKAAILQFRNMKALRISETIIAGAAAAIKAVADLAIVNPIAAAAVGTAIAAQTALSVAQIKAQKPPKFHTGGMVQPDETPAILRRGEAVLSERAAQRLGRQAIERLNRDEPIGSVNIYLGDDLLRSQRMTRAPRGGTHTPVGARSPYLGR